MDAAHERTAEAPRLAIVGNAGLAPVGADRAAPAGMSEADWARKAFEKLRADLAFGAYTLSRTNEADGPVRYYVQKFGLIKECLDLDAVADFARQAGCSK